LNSRTFSLAITAWSANVSTSLICAEVKGVLQFGVRTRFQLVPPADEVERPKAYARIRRAPLKFILHKRVGNVTRTMLTHPANLWLIKTNLKISQSKKWDQNAPEELKSHFR
jgi:hypothetical protein